MPNLSLETHQQQWEELAQLDPLFAILTEKEKQYGKWDEEEFFASGRAEIDRLMASCGFQAGDNGRALDFGCGVGRLSRTLRAYFGEVYGLDISQEMVELARRFTPSCTFLLNEDPILVSMSAFQEGYPTAYEGNVKPTFMKKLLSCSYMQCVERRL